MDIEEIKCSLCTMVYNENERMPILLPDCGHSFCLSCINDCFELIRTENQDLDDEDLLGDDDLLGKDNEDLHDRKPEKKVQLFECPEDAVLCSIQSPELLPKNFALLKIVQKTIESEEYKKKNIVSIKYDKVDQKYVVQPKIDKSLAGFLRSQTIQPKNFESLSKNSSTSVEQEAMQAKPSFSEEDHCLEHDRPLELICVDDKRRICSQCALFGKHKGHDVRMEEDVAKEINLKVEVLMEMYQAMEQTCESLQDKSNYERNYNLFKKKQNEVKDQIQEKFKEWRQALRAVEMQALENLHIVYSQFEDKFSFAQKQNQKMILEAEGWMDKAKSQIDQYTVNIQENPHYIDFSMLENAKDLHREDDILNMGEGILEKVEKKRGYPTLNGLESGYNQVKVSFEPNIEKKLAQICKIIGPGKANDSNQGDCTTASASFLPPFTVEEVEIVDGKIGQTGEDGSGNPLSLSNISFNESPSPINQTVNEELSEERKEQLLQRDEASMIKKNISQLRRGTTLIGGGTKIAKKTDLATMFKTSAFNGELDLSGKNFSDMHSNELAKCIKMHSGHIKSLNLSKNKLSDEGLMMLAKALCESSIESVNLSSNKITEKNIDNFVGTLKTNKTLKFIDLSNNGIGSRVVKNKLKNALPSIEVLM